MTEMRHGKWWDRLGKQMETVPLDKIMEGRFTRLFPGIPGAKFDQADLEKLAEKMTAPQETNITKETDVDPEENQGIDSAYTYLGQFVDHDLTLDTTSHLREFLTEEQLKALVDFRTPRFDLDNVYGRGPDEEPFMYDGDGLRLLLGDPMSGNPFDTKARQLPRSPNGRALIGDPRNDENRIVAQLHTTMLRFHNAMADKLLHDKPGTTFADIRNQVRWHYQWVLVNDFLPTIINAATVASVFPDPYHPKFKIRKIQHQGNLELMPVEFSVAAYRFGHSMIRPQYRLNTTIQRRPIFSKHFEQDAADLGGFRPIPSDWAIDWQFFIDIGDTDQVDGLDDPITRKVQKAYKIDTSLVSPLHDLPPAVAVNPSILAARNLLRGATFELPSGQAVAHAMGEPVIPNDKLVIGKATFDDEKDQVLLSDVAPGFRDNAPLWAYVLSEAQVTSWAHLPANVDKATKDATPIRLGPVGGRIVAEVFAALLLGDRTSYLNAVHNFTPIPELTKAGTFGLAQLINVALGRTP
ncbi:MAG: hypothetical protein QOH66_44 [Actinomycetota bacterium]|nr:hypothetical protein [Actinomycetota bacterium]